MVTDLPLASRRSIFTQRSILSGASASLQRAASLAATPSAAVLTSSSDESSEPSSTSASSSSSSPSPILPCDRPAVQRSARKVAAAPIAAPIAALDARSILLGPNYFSLKKNLEDDYYSACIRYPSR
eukprot:scaffold47636_cov29-Tisochrysis_lutea.AAC.4